MRTIGVIILLVYGSLLSAGIGYVLLRYLGIQVDGVTLGVGALLVVALFYISTLDKVEGLFAPVVSAIGSVMSRLTSALVYLIILFFIVGIPVIVSLMMPPIPMGTTHALLGVVILFLLVILHELRKRNH
jgi:hypothetical protein